MNTVYISCPAKSYTGGPTLAHQLCYVLNKNGINAKMWYFGNRFKVNKENAVHPNYLQYNLQFVLENPEDISSNTIVAIESNVGILRKFHHAKKMIWWMSVDNYFLNMTSFICLLRKRYLGFKPSIDYCKKYRNKSKYRVIFESDILHLVQSEYARLFLLDEGISKDKILDLSDYLEDELINNIENTEVDKKNRILYNPKKGFSFTEAIMRAVPEFEWTAIENMTKQQVAELLCASKLYIDFGNHPGKDRFPREAVICGCCIITGRNGAAGNKIDIPIDDSYKFENDLENIPKIADKIRYVINNYDSCVKDFDEYKSIIRNEKEKFIHQALNIFSDKKGEIK